MRIFGLNGSLQAASSNLAVLTAAARETDDAEIVIFEALRDIPAFDASMAEDRVPPSVHALRSGIAQSDGVLIVSPEYAHSMPGVLKNALDWLVGSGELASKPVAIITVSPTPTGGLRAQTALVQTLLAQSADIVALLPIAASRLKIDENGAINHAPTLRRIMETLRALLERGEELKSVR